MSDLSPLFWLDLVRTIALPLGAISGGYLLGVGRWRIGGALLLASVVLLAENVSPMPLRGNMQILAIAVVVYLSMLGFVAGLLRCRRWFWAAATVFLFGLCMTVPNMIGRGQLAQLEAVVIESAIVPHTLDLAGARLVVLTSGSSCSSELIERFDLASLHCGWIHQFPPVPPWDFSEIALTPPLSEPADYLLVTSRLSYFVDTFPELAGLPSEIAGLVEGEAYLFDAALWPAPDSLIARQVLAYHRIPELWVPFLPWRPQRIGYEQSGVPLFCAVRQYWFRNCRP